MSSWSAKTYALVGAAALTGVVAAFVLNRRKNMLHLTPLERMAVRNGLMHTAPSVEAGRAFKPKPTDVFVVTYPKCGTTWVTQIAHVLRTRGDQSFGEITEVVPWDICAVDCGQDLDSDHVASPRVFKSHERFETVAKGGKYIYVARDPLDAFVSFYRFLPAYMGLKPGEVSMSEFADAIFAGVSVSGGIWDHFLQWWRHRHDPNVLWLSFEDLKDDLPTCIERIAKFMDIALDAELRATTLKLASFEWMSAHDKQFDDHFVRDAVRDRMGLDRSGVDTNIGPGAACGRVWDDERWVSKV